MPFWTVTLLLHEKIFLGNIITIPNKFIKVSSSVFKERCYNHVHIPV